MNRTIPLSAVTSALLMLATLLGSVDSFGSCNEWATGGPWGGVTPARSLTFDPHSVQRVFLGAEAGVFVSTNSGASWGHSSDGISRFVLATAFAPSAAGVVFAAGAGVHRSDDGGASWTGSPGFQEPVASLAVHPTDDQVLYAGTFFDGVHESVDGGATWVDRNNGLSNLQVRTVVFDPSSPQVLLAGTSTGLFRSTGPAVSWTSFGLGLPPDGVWELVWDTSTPPNLFAATNSGVYKSTNAGASWSSSTAGLGAVRVDDLAVDAAAPQVLFAATDNGVYRSGDGGANWVLQSGLPSEPFDSVAVLGGNVVAAGQETIYRSADSGASWSTAIDGFSGLFFHSLGISGSRLLAGSAFLGVYVSDDGGGSWAASNTGIDTMNGPRHFDVREILADPFAVDTVVIATGAGVYKSTNNGDSWTFSSNGLPSLSDGPFASSLLVDTDLAGTYYVGLMGEGVYKSIDGGNSWTPASTGLTSQDVWKIEQDPVSLSLYAATFDAGVFRSDDRAASWAPVSNGLPAGGVFELAIAPGAPSTLFASVLGHGLFESYDGGANWTPSSLVAGTDFIYSLAVNPLRQDELVAGSDNGLYHSLNRGETWMLANPEQPTLWPWALLFDSHVDGLLHAAFQTFSVQRRSLDDSYEMILGAAGDDFCPGSQLILGAPQSHRHCDQDWVYFDGIAGETYRIETSGLSTDSDTTIALSENCGPDIAFDDDGGIGMASRIDFTPTTDGVVTVRIEQAGDAYDAGDVYDVSLEVVTGLIFDDGFESGDASSWSSVTP